MGAPDVGARERVSAILFNALISYESGGCCGPSTSTQEVETICDDLADRILAALAETREGERIEGFIVGEIADAGAADDEWDLRMFSRTGEPGDQPATLILHAPPTTQEEP